MFELFKAHQLDIMIVLSSMCGITALFAWLTTAMSKEKRWLLVGAELCAMLLLAFDRCAYIFRGDISDMGYYMVRISNFIVFLMTLLVPYIVSIYLRILLKEGKLVDHVLKRFRASSVLTWIGVLLLVISQFTGLYYTFDEYNQYQRSSWFIVCYIIPVLVIIIQLSIIIQYYKRINKLVRISILMFGAVSMVASILQLFAYGISLTNLCIALVILLLYVFALVDMNQTVEKANELQINFLKEEHESMERLFDQTATAFVNALDAKDAMSHNHSREVANYSRMIAEQLGKTKEECHEIYYAGLLHDIGKIGIPDSVIQNESSLSEEEYEYIRQKPVIADEILSSIDEYPYLREGAHYCYEWYDGTGYPDGLKGEEIPEIARIVAVADAYASMSSSSRYRDALPKQVIREEFVNGSGTQFDPHLASVMIDIIDKDMTSNERGIILEEELHCGDYRDKVSHGLVLSDSITRIRYIYEPYEGYNDAFSIPSIILFYSLDGRTHNTYKSVEEYRYIEYGEMWMDGHSINTKARNMKANAVDISDSLLQKGECEIEAFRVEDHVKIVITTSDKRMEFVIALSDSALHSYIAITGEHCYIHDIKTEKLEGIVGEDEIERIADKISYINRLENDIPNTQIDETRSATTNSIELVERARLGFHSMSLPSSSLVWHCPYVVLFCSDDGSVEGDNYKEYALIKLNGESSGDENYASNNMVMNREDDFTNWDEWKERNKEGLEYEVSFIRYGNRIITITKNLGVSIVNTTQIKKKTDKVYVALTGDQCALTDIRVKG